MTGGMYQKNPLDSRIKDKIGLQTGSFSRQALRDYQLKRLQETIDYVFRNSPFYRKRFKGYGETRLTCPEDLARLPFTTPHDIREHALQMLCVSQSEIERVVTLESSGTTGEPKRLYFTRDDQELTIDFFMQGMSFLTSPGERVLILLPGERPGSIGDLLHTALTRIGVIPIKHGIIKSLPDTLEKLAATRADVLVGIPVQVLALARYYDLRGRGIPVFLKRMLLSTDYVPRAVIQEADRIWGCEVYNYFGMTEMGLGGGIECGNHHGYHLYEGDFFLEIVDPKTEEAVAEGRYGEVVFTTLTRRGMPLVRYRTGDLSRFVPGECSCGSITRRLEKIMARKTGVVPLAGDCYLKIADLDEALLALPGIVDFSATVSRLQDSPRLKILISVLGPVGNLQDIRRELLRIPALGYWLKQGTPELSVELCECDDSYVPRTGKRQIIIE